MKHFEYKGYLGSCKVSIIDNCLHGKIEFISDLVNYEAQTTEELKKEFELAGSPCKLMQVVFYSDF